MKWETLFWFAIVFIIILGIISIFSLFPRTNGTQRWATYTGTLLEFNIDCSQCCHPSSSFHINTSDGVKGEFIGDCDENLEHVLHVGNVYTIRIEPYQEPYAITVDWGEPAYFWAVHIDWVKDANGVILWGSDWIW